MQNLIFSNLVHGVAVQHQSQIIKKHGLRLLHYFEDYKRKNEFQVFLCFGDPTSPVPSALEFIDECLPKSVVVGGLSSPTKSGISSLALNDQVLAPGTVAGVALSGNAGFALHSVTAQGALGIGPTFKVTSGRLNLVHTLDAEPALSQVQKVALTAIRAQPRLAQLLQNSLLVGLTESDESTKQDFLIRTVVGATSDGAIAIGDNTISENSTRLRIHVRDGETARTELDNLLQRYSLERAITGFSGVRPSAILLCACNGRGKNMFRESNFEINKLSSVFTSSDEASPDVSSIPVAGFFANGEIGPTGAVIPSSSSDDKKSTYLHGFTSVIAFIYDDLDSSDLHEKDDDNLPPQEQGREV
mmetsp:Transcript_833/g.1051  ORF Transcript_833/g.1051 Transcript_833/m.1051 type:complete len:359 (-) Transcript_833:279-1355(-)